MWEIKYGKGVHLPQIGWSLDAQMRVARSFVSHAHGDHIARHPEVLCTAPTARLMHARMPGKRTFTTPAYGRAQPIDFGTTATLYPAGHILGSSQILLDSPDHGRLLYTGDFKLRPSLAAEACATPQTDLLIMETTFGLPRYVFPPDEVVIGQILDFCRQAVDTGAVPVLLCYSLGKSQEILRALGPLGLPVMLHGETLRLTKIYEQCGITFPAYREFDRDSCGGHVVICPPHSQGLLAHIPARRTAALTGWALDAGVTYRMRCDAAFPLSDHAGYDDLLMFVSLVKPKRVLTLHGFAKEFARDLRARGTEAFALGHDHQLDLALPD